jgi:hypothetical protein
MIVDYQPHPDGEEAFNALAEACAELEIVCEGAWRAEGKDAGRVYLAVKNGTSDTAVMNHLRRAELPCELVQIHPTPPKRNATTKNTAKPKKPATTKAAKLKKPATTKKATKPKASGKKSPKRK